MNRMRAAIGMFGIANRHGLVSPDYAVLEPIEPLAPEYYSRLFKTPSAKAVFRIESKGLGTGSSGFMRLYTDRFGMIKLPAPPIEEQREIISTIENNVAELELTEERLRREVELLREYRNRLMADVVTGKLDVRDSAERLSEEQTSCDTAEFEDEVEDDEQGESAESVEEVQA
jgi:type I restriction enzyme, S subunit